MHVVKRSGFWGQGEEVLPDLPASSSSTSSSHAAGDGAAAGEAGGAVEAAAAVKVMPLGQLEFVLDRRRRPRGDKQQ